MYPRLKISNLLIERLEKLQDGCFGYLYGVQDNESVLLLSFNLSGVKQDGKEPQDNEINLGKGFVNDIIHNLPAGILLCGAFRVTNEDTLTNINEKLFDCVPQCSVFINVNAKSKKLMAACYEDGSSEKCEFTIVNQKDVTDLLLNLRIHATFSLQCDSEMSFVESTLKDLETKILSGNAAFQFEDTNVYIFGGKDNNINGISPKSTVKDLLKHFNESDKMMGENKNIILKVQVFMNQANNDDSPKLAPLIKYVKKKFKYIEIQILLDALVTTLKTLPITHLYKFLVNGTHRNFLLHKQNLINQLEKNKLYNVTTPETYHFFPSALGHFFSIVYCPKENADNLKHIREAFHKQLALPMDKPLFRQANAYDFSKPTKSNQNLLLNPHESVAKSGVPDGQAYFVQGLYAYHHYMQDNYDDNGWGCAYRSLQTIFSWFRLQGYTTMTVPSHKEIQQCLVNIGDKPSSFVGSKQWIGSTEVSFVLDTMLGVTSRIVSVSSGEEMTMKGGELSHHFRTQGTPIMIGGGVLAHTIIGIDYNKNTGDMKFLILDPHYTGEEDLNVIVKKGWCGWKGPEFWKKNAFYNMCLPLTPKCV